ncbi:helix-turn-helix transcriptional regulator [Bernardetia sp. Wsw4-3y2]|uniref:helix-turn-helix transcriptional regulator n=1 Tax=Bernardetia sp. Wsw4-3y2 TaxID=3127471 RepID=UPI0030D03DCB
MYDIEEFYKQLDLYMKRNGLNAQEVADLIGVSRGTVYNYLSKESKPNFEKASKIFKILELDTELLYLKKEKLIPNTENEKGKVEGKEKGKVEGKVTSESLDFYENVIKGDFKTALIIELRKQIETLERQTLFYEQIIRQKFEL